MWGIKNGWGKAAGLWCNEWGGGGKNSMPWETACSDSQAWGMEGDKKSDNE